MLVPLHHILSRKVLTNNGGLLIDDFPLFLQRPLASGNGLLFLLDAWLFVMLTLPNFRKNPCFFALLLKSLQRNFK